MVFTVSPSGEKNVGWGLKTGHIIAISIAGFVVLVGGLAAVIACILIRRKRGQRPHRVYIDHHGDDEKGSKVALHPFGDRMVGGGEKKYYNQDHDRRSFFEHKVTVIPLLTEFTQKNPDPGDRDKGSRSFETGSTSPGSQVEADLSLLPLPLPSPYEQDDIVSTLQQTSVQVQERQRPSLSPLITGLRAGNIVHSSSPKPGSPYDSTSTASPSASDVALDHYHHEEVDGEEEEEAGRDSPSMYSQSSASVLFNMISSSLHRGPSMMSYASGTFDLQPTIHESLFDASRTDAAQPQISQRRELTGGLERQSTTVIAGLLKSRQRQQLPKDVDVDTNESDELFSHPSISAVSHIERAGSIIKPSVQVTGAGVAAAGVTHEVAENASTTREPYGRRLRRMAAEREAASLAPVS